MNYFGLFKNKYTVYLRKILLNLLLLILPTSNKFIIALSQNLDKHIVVYQKDLCSHENVNDDSAEIFN